MRSEIQLFKLMKTEIKRNITYEQEKSNYTYIYLHISIRYLRVYVRYTLRYFELRSNITIVHMIRGDLE